MSVEIFVRSWRNGARSFEADLHGSTAVLGRNVDQRPPANDNEEVWPLVPFPDGWHVPSPDGDERAAD